MKKGSTPKKPNRLYDELKMELAICQIGGLFLALYEDENVPELIISKLQKDLPDYFQFSVQMTEKKVWFPIFFEQTFEQVGKQSNIYHVLGIETLSEKSQEDFLQYLQYGRERFKALPYSIVFWIHPPFAKKLFHAAPDFHHWVFGTYDFTKITTVVLNRNEEKRLAFHRDAQAIFLNNIDQHLEKLIWQYEHWREVKNSGKAFVIEVMSRANLSDYYVNLYGTDKDRTVWLLDDRLDEFLDNDKQSFMTLLGDFGTGKSSFSLHYFIAQARRYMLDKSRRIPLFVSLKDYPGRLNIETFITNEFAEKFGLSFSSLVFQDLALQGKFLFCVDGFDEMVSMSDKQETTDNFKELAKLTFENLQFVIQSELRRQTNKVFMTCRTHYFFNDFKIDYLFLHNNYTFKKNYKPIRIYVKVFGSEQIKDYILKNVGNEALSEEILGIIKNTYNLEELSNRPLLLEMIVKTLPELKAQKQINAAELYKVYTNMWIERDDWRSQMTPDGKRKFMWELAVKMSQKSGDFSLHYSHLAQPKKAFLKQHLDSLEKDYYKYEATTCSFLNRDLSGNYKFIHKSFMEYFVAEYLFDCLKKHQASLLEYSKTNEEVNFFLKMIISVNKQKLSHLNLSGLTLNGTDLQRANLEGTILEGANLQSANLEGANLHGANLEGANLHRTNFEESHLEKANLKRANLQGASLQGANLANANLTLANLQGAKLQAANLQKANLQEANLVNTSLLMANLEGVNFEGANLDGANIRLSGS
ncbi:MAG: hypothetical protein DRR19_01780 [Candidatus Parabeggiatoa sp. nov. 1]|nr:MAG: hypothetical protein DRR19_01780 [Gammaproteobacteria bacterium]